MTGVPNQAAAGAGPIVLSVLNGIPRSTTGPTNRIGNQIRAVSLWISGQIQMSSAVTAAGGACRILVYHDKEGGSNIGSNAAGAPWNKLFQSSPNYNIADMRNNLFFERYRILYDKLHTMMATGTVSSTPAGGPTLNFQARIPLHNKKICYTGFITTAPVGNLNYNGSSAGTALYSGDLTYGGGALPAGNFLQKDDIYLLVAASDGSCCKLTSLNFKTIFTDD